LGEINFEQVSPVPWNYFDIQWDWNWGRNIFGNVLFLG